MDNKHVSILGPILCAMGLDTSICRPIPDLSSLHEENRKVTISACEDKRLRIEFPADSVDFQSLYKEFC